MTYYTRAAVTAALDSYVACVVTLDDAEAVADVALALPRLRRAYRLALWFAHAGFDARSLAAYLQISLAGAKRLYPAALAALTQELNHDGTASGAARPDLLR